MSDSLVTAEQPASSAVSQLNADAWVSILKLASPSDTRSCALVSTELRAASRDDDLWRSHCRAREVADGVADSAVDAWIDELRTSTRMPTFAALFALLELTGMAGGVGHWSSVSRQPNGALLTTRWVDGQLVGALTRRALAEEDPMLGLRTDWAAFALTPVVQHAPPPLRAVRVRLQLSGGEQYLGALSGSGAEIRFATRPGIGTQDEAASGDLEVDGIDGANGFHLNGSGSSGAQKLPFGRAGGGGELIAVFASGFPRSLAKPLQGLHVGLERAFGSRFGVYHSRFRDPTKRLSERFLRLTGNGLIPHRAVRSLACGEGAPAALEGAGELTGLYVSRYGTHGLELIEVVHLQKGVADVNPIDPFGVRSPASGASSRAEQNTAGASLPERLAFRKVLGDQNVPANFLTLRVPLEPMSRRTFYGQAHVDPQAAAGTPQGGHAAESQVGACPIEPQHLAHLQAAGIPPGALAGVVRGEMQLNKEPLTWLPEWDPLLLFLLKPHTPGGPMQTWAALWCTLNLVLTFRRFEPERHAWRPTDPPSERRAISHRVSQDIGGGFTFVGDWTADGEDE